MSIDAGAAVVILLYVLTLAAVLFVSPRLETEFREKAPFWRSPRFWASLVAVVQIIIYALWS